MAAIRTELRRGKEALNPQDLTARPTRFVLTEANELRPACIRDGLCQVMIFDHTSDIQRLKRDRTVLVNQFTTQLVLKVFALVGNVFVQFGHGQTRFLPSVAALDLAAQTALSDLQAPFATVQMPGLFPFVFVTQGGKGGQTQVNRDSFNFGCWVFNFQLDLADSGSTVCRVCCES